MILTKKGHNFINELQLYVLLIYSAAQLQECLLLNLLTYLFSSDREFPVTRDWHTKLNSFLEIIDLPLHYHSHHHRHHHHFIMQIHR